MNNNLLRLSDGASFATILLTLFLFVIALFLKGFTHDLLLEAGVFLVSVKLILMSYKQKMSTAVLQKTLDEVNEKLSRMQSKDQTS
ncbi:MAG: hypothetical protein JWR69_2856 [Pedosphaera sp.]|jgi:hypothetical protein|nr:hypothetical protein [Pedosphaera sp.]